MSSAKDHLREWLAAGLIDERAVARIEAYEETARRPAPERPSVLEALIYLGIAIAGVGVAVLIGSRWTHLESWARVAAPAIPALLAALAGQRLRLDARADFRRGGRVAWLAAVALATLAAGIAGHEYGLNDDDAILLAGCVGLALAVLAWWPERSDAQVVGMAAATLLLAMSAPPRAPANYEPTAGGLAIALGGCIGLLLVETRLLTPAASAGTLSAGFVGFGSFISSAGPEFWPEFIVFFGAALLVALGLLLGRFVYLGLGVAALFVGLINIILRNVHNTTAASLALVIIGIVLIAVVIALGRSRPWQRDGGGLISGAA